MFQFLSNLFGQEEVRLLDLLLDADWPTTPPLWTEDHKSLLLSKQPQNIPDLTLPEIVKASSEFPIEFPKDTMRCYQLQNSVGPEILIKNINSTYPVIHEQGLFLCSKFLLYQTKFGNKQFYQDMSLLDLIDRLLGKRAVSFVNPMDHYKLMNGVEGTGNWKSIGTSREAPPLTLDSCLSYDEIKLSALLSVSSQTCFINDGNRNNGGRVETDLSKIEETGVIVGLIGARLPKDKVMEYREIVKEPHQNNVSYGYGTVKPTLQAQFLEFYGDVNATYKQLLKKMQSFPERYIDMGHGRYFDKAMFERRIALSIDTLLIEANDRAKKEGTKAFVHVVGLGLGVWRICLEQDKIFMDTFAKRLEFLKNNLESISDVCFAYIRHSMMGPYKDGEYLDRIKIHIRNRNPHDKLQGEDKGKLLVVSYAWDANALPGNEFWWGSLTSSSDPAAASSTQVAELHNYHINGKVRGDNLRVATLKNGIVTFEEYQKLHQND